MTLDISARRKRLIEEIKRLSEQNIAKLEQQMQVLTQEEKLQQVIKPMRKSLSIEDMKAASTYRPMSKVVFYQKVAALDISEPIEDLLKMLD